MRLSERIYAVVIHLYPREYREQFGDEMQFVFAESLRDAQESSDKLAVGKLWLRTWRDALGSLMVQHIHTVKGDHTMKSTNVLSSNTVFVWIALGTAMLLLVPLVAMQFTASVNWSLFDFVVAAIVIFGVASLYVLAARRFPRRRLLLAAMAVLAFLYIWAELAVGVFTTLGS